MGGGTDVTGGLGARARRAVARSGWEAKTILAEHPSVAVPLAKWRGHGEIVTSETEIVIEAFARSAQSYVVAAFRLAQEPHAVRIAHHTHSPSTLIEGMRRSIPTLVIVREPEDAILSYVIRTPAISLRGALRGYVRFHRPLLPYRDRLVVATFGQVTEDLATVTMRVNDRFDASFGAFDPTDANVKRVFAEIEADERTRTRSDDVRERAIPRPSAFRQDLKAGLHAPYGSDDLRTLRLEAERLYGTLASDAAK
jgi:hypothetical protein